MDIADNIKDSTSSTGTGDFTFSGAPEMHFLEWLTAPIVVGSRVPYSARHRTLPEWENGYGTMLSRYVMQRTEVTASSNNGQPVNFSAGVKDVACDLTAALFGETSGAHNDVATAVPDSGTVEFMMLVDGRSPKRISLTAMAAAIKAIIDGQAEPTPAAATVMNLWTGTPTTDGAVISTRLAATGSAASIRVAVSTSEALTNPTYTAALVPDATYRTVKHTITGKAPNTEYWYAVEVDGVLDLATKGRFKTLPAAGTPASFTIALGGCAENTNDAAFAAINALPTKPLFLMTLGDFQYMDLAAPTTADYHAAFDVSLGYGARKITHSQIPTVYNWDDHDFWTNDATGRDLNNVIKSARNTALAFFRSRIPAITASSTATDTAHHSFVVGRVRFVISDLRSDKTGQTAADNANKTMMGAAQKAWWKAEIAAAKAAGQIVVWASSVPWVQAVVGSGDQWGSYNTERVELADYIKAQGMAGKVCIVSSDMHALAIHTGADYATGGGAAIPVFHAGPFNRAGSTKGGPYTTGPYPGNSTAVRQYGLMDLADDGTTITVTFKGYSADGTLRMSHSFSATPGAAAPATAPAKMAAPTATAGNGQVTLDLVAPNNGGSPITYFTIPNLPANAVDQQAGTAALTRTITGLANGVSRTFTATATNDVGTSPTSDPSNPVTPMAPVEGVFEATGGVITTPGDGYKYWTFLASDTLNVTSGGDVEYLVVGGGGGGGRGSTSGVGGGGAGGVRTGTLNLTAIAHAITVGAGGVGSDATSVNNGLESSIAALVVAAGGGGGGYSATAPGNGGSGGGAGSASTATAVGTGTSGQGNNGGAAAASSTQANRAGGGGGGAGSAGGAAASGAGGNGGEGVTVWGRLLAGGGGGAAQSSSGTQGVGKAGGTDATRGTTVPANATANTGSGGGAHITTVTGSGAGKGGDGGSGIVIIRRAVPA